MKCGEERNRRMISIKLVDGFASIAWLYWAMMVRPEPVSLDGVPALKDIACAVHAMLPPTELKGIAV